VSLVLTRLRTMDSIPSSVSSNQFCIGLRILRVCFSASRKHPHNRFKWSSAVTNFAVVTDCRSPILTLLLAGMSTSNDSAGISAGGMHSLY